MDDLRLLCIFLAGGCLAVALYRFSGVETRYLRDKIDDLTQELRERRVIWWYSEERIHKPISLPDMEEALTLVMKKVNNWSSRGEDNLHD